MGALPVRSMGKISGCDYATDYWYFIDRDIWIIIPEREFPGYSYNVCSMRDNHYNETDERFSITYF